MWYYRKQCFHRPSQSTFWDRPEYPNIWLVNNNYSISGSQRKTSTTYSKMQRWFPQPRQSHFCSRNTRAWQNPLSFQNEKSHKVYLLTNVSNKRKFGNLKIPLYFCCYLFMWGRDGFDPLPVALISKKRQDRASVVLKWSHSRHWDSIRDWFVLFW